VSIGCLGIDLPSHSGLRPERHRCDYNQSFFTAGQLFFATDSGNTRAVNASTRWAFGLLDEPKQPA
jgi:hypothetical protein